MHLFVKPLPNIKFKIVERRYDFAQLMSAYMGVNLGGPAAFMPQYLLNIPQICPLFEQMSCIAVPQPVQGKWLFQTG